MVKLQIAGKNEWVELSPSKIIALGLNYRDHIEESHSVNVQGFTKETPSEPVLFPKTPNTLIGPEETIRIPAFLQKYGFEDLRTDYEAELACIIGKRCRKVPEDEAYDYILGYTCLNDVSQRNLQTSDKSGWFRGKSLDTFAPTGPVIVRHEDIGDPQDLRIQARLNGETRQDSNTRHMIFPIPEIIAFISRQITLEAGDIISTGTPAGVGRIRHGDTVEIEIEKIGVLRNPVAEEQPEDRLL
jgi:2-keto-4-pentenoate hydratase/2-oxohepta-3-ene-1,7-dioic acid hydratase in catechol pathway